MKKKESMKSYLRIVALLLLVMAALPADAVKALSTLREVTASDGTTLRVRLVGDEYFHTYLTEDGYPLVERDGDFYYCDFDAEGRIVESDIKATSPGERGIEATAFLRKIDLGSLETRLQTRAAKSPRRQSLRAVRKVEARAERTVEGTWTFSLGDYYFQTSVGGPIEVEFTATLYGTQIWFEDNSGNYFPFVAEFDEAKSTLTFSREYLGSTGQYYVYQDPFVYADGLNFQTIVGQLDDDYTEITFGRENGLAWRAYNNEAGRGESAGYFDVFDFEGAVRPESSVNPGGGGTGEDPEDPDGPGEDPGNPSGPPYEKGYGLFPSNHFPAYGDQKAIVILVEYTDVKFHSGYDPARYFQRMLNVEGFSGYGATGSVAEYFRDNSAGYFNPEFDVYGPIQLSHDMAYYGGNDRWGNDSRPAAMVLEACKALDPTVDFRDYDRDGDGIVDNIFIFYAGQGEASGGSADSVWPHSWDMFSAGYSYPDLYFDGVLLYTYGCSNEWQTYSGSGRPDGVGTFIHEFSHVMGLPDLYSTGYTDAFTPGTWSVLDAGSYNNDGMTPPCYGAFERYALGWVRPHEIDREMSVTLHPVSENVCGIIRTPKDTEFFLLENRQQEGWDEYIPYHGMLVWHVDYNESKWIGNEVNNTASHQYVDLVEADGTRTENSRKGDAFPGTGRRTSFTSQTNPAMKTWGGKALDYPITSIAETDGIITFDVLGGVETEPLVALDATDVVQEGFTANWTLPGDDARVFLTVFSRDEDGEKIPFEDYSDKDVGNVDSFHVVGTLPETTYYYYVWHTDGWQTSGPSNEISVTTTVSLETGLGRLEGEDVRLVARGLELTLSSFTSDEEMVVADLAGAIVARGFGTVTVPSRGIYIVTLPASGKAFKVVV